MQCAAAGVIQREGVASAMHNGIIIQNQGSRCAVDGLQQKGVPRRLDCPGRRENCKGGGVGPDIGEIGEGAQVVGRMTRRLHSAQRHNTVPVR